MMVGSHGRGGSVARCRPSVSGSLAIAARRGHPPRTRTSQDRGLRGHDRPAGRRASARDGAATRGRIRSRPARQRQDRAPASAREMGRPGRPRLPRAGKRRNELTGALQEIPARIDPCTGPLPDGGPSSRTRRTCCPPARETSIHTAITLAECYRSAILGSEPYEAPRRSGRSRLSVGLDGGAAR
jgi:vacuolar-type H+-ATPase catalytic subunit A/Vma1